MIADAIHVRDYRVSECAARLRYLRLHIDNTTPNQLTTSEATRTECVWPPDVLSMQLNGRADRGRRVGKCIYCGAKAYGRDDRPALGSEHVIMRAVGGTVELLEASCGSCENATGKFEHKTLSTLFAVPREVLSVRTRATSKRHRLDFTVQVAGEDAKRRLPIETHPKLLILPRLDLPGWITGAHPSQSGLAGFWYENLGDAACYEGIYTPAVDTVTFCQFIAKIGHAYAVWRLGLGTFEPFLTLPIRTDFGKAELWERRYLYVGGRQEHFKPSAELHQLAIGAYHCLGERLLLVQVRLFACLGTPVYVVVVGRLPPNHEQGPDFDMSKGF